MDSLQIRRLALSEIHPDPANVRLHGTANKQAIRASLARFQQVEPLLVQAGTRRLIAGHGRLEAMRELGWSEADVVELDVTDIEATSLAIALNRSGELAEWDEHALARILQSLPTAERIGFDDAQLDELIASITPPKEIEDPGPGEPPVTPVTQTGDLWLLGDHRIHCGDSTKPEDMARLMNGEKAWLLATDSPYLVNYRGGNHPQSSVNSAEVKDKNWDDYVDPETSVEFFATFLRVALEHCVERVPVYNWHASKRQPLLEEAWKQNGLLSHQQLIWSKARAVLTRSHYMWAHEPCLYGWREGFMPEHDRRPPPSERSVWEIDQIGQQDGIHPTQKPVEIFERPIRFHTRVGEVVCEPFSGSGTQIIAAETLNRRCYAMEISPAYVDVAVVRWQNATGKQATLEGSGQSFEEVRSSRVAAS